MFTIARALITDSSSFFPWEDHRFVQDMQGIPLYYNPLVNMILEKLEINDKCVYKIEGDTWKVWYPLDSYIEDLEATNEVLHKHGFELYRVCIKASNEFNNDEIPDETLNIIESALPMLRKRLNPNSPPRIPEYGIILEDDAHDWQFIYEALFMGQLMTSGEEKWKFYVGYRGEIPSDYELNKLKVLIFPGSGQSAYDQGVKWIPVLGELVQKVRRNYPHIKLIGGCFGAQLFAQYLGGKVEKMFLGPDRPKILGREQIKLTDDFFKQPFLQKYLNDHNLTRETFPTVVLQESHGDSVTQLPEGATLLGYSDSCDIEIYSIDNTVLAFQSHPEFNCGFQQELSEPEYYKYGVISLSFHKTAFLKCQDSSMGIETRNLILGIMREFLKYNDKKTASLIHS